MHMFLLRHRQRAADNRHFITPFYPCCTQLDHKKNYLGWHAVTGTGRVPWHSLYKHSLYVTKFIRTFFIQDRFYAGRSLYRTNFIRGQNLYEDKVYMGTKFIWDKVYTVKKFIRGQSLYKLFSYCTWIKGYKVNVKNMYIIQSNHIRVCNCYCYCLLIIPWIYDQDRNRLGQSTESIHERYPWTGGYARKEMVTLSGVRAYMVTMYLQVEMYNLWWFYMN